MRFGSSLSGWYENVQYDSMFGKQYYKTIVGSFLVDRIIIRQHNFKYLSTKEVYSKTLFRFLFIQNKAPFLRTKSHVFSTQKPDITFKL